MVGSVRYISNISRTPATYVTIANNKQLHANTQGIVVLQAQDSNTHMTFNDELYVPDLRFNLLSAGQLRDCGVMLATDPYTRDLILTYALPDTPVESHKYLGRARSLNSVYVLDFDIPNCQASPHPEEINLHQPGPDGICTTCFTPTASRTEEVVKDLAVIQEVESAEAEPSGMTEMELAVTTHPVFGIGDEKLGLTEQQRPTLRTETLRWILEEAHGTTFDQENRPRPYTRDIYRNFFDKAWKDHDAKEELSVKEEERLAAGWDEESPRCGGWRGDDEGTGTTWGSATRASCTVQGWGAGGWGNAERRDLAEGDFSGPARGEIPPC
ncbi:unnamed protein product [Closterium sp. NIES-53]